MPTTLAEHCAILVPTRARPSVLAISLQKMIDKGLTDLPLFVYDDNSPDSEQIRNVVNLWPNGHLIQGRHTIGQAAGRNILMRACNREYALLLDDDQYFLDLGNLENYIGFPPDQGGPAVVTFARIAKSDGRRDLPAALPAMMIHVFMGGTTLVHVSSVLSVGGFRDYWFFGYEEPELSFRLYQAGFYIWYEPSIVMEHNQFYTDEEARDVKLYDFLYARNAILMSTLNTRLWLAIPEGLARSFRRSMLFKRNFGSKVWGTLSGIKDTFRYFDDRAPVAASLWLKWRRMEKSFASCLSSLSKDPS